MFERHRLERLEGKEYNEPNVSVTEALKLGLLSSRKDYTDVPQPSAAMDNANKKFSFLHAVTSSLNLVSFIGLAGLGLAVSM